jgi:hypothetical protein
MPAAKATPGRKAAPAKTPPPAAHPPAHHTEQVVKSQPVPCEIRINGRIRFANLIYDPAFQMTDQTVTFTADLEPTWIERQLPEPTRFVDQADPRDGEDIIMKVHSGRRDIAQEQP